MYAVNAKCHFRFQGTFFSQDLHYNQDLKMYFMIQLPEAMGLKVRDRHYRQMDITVTCSHSVCPLHCVSLQHCSKPCCRL